MPQFLLHRRAPWWLSLVLAALPVSHAAEPHAMAQVYQQPSDAMRAVLDAPNLPQYLLSPDQRTLATLKLRAQRPIAELARPLLRLAGQRFDAAVSGPALIAPIERLSLRSLESGALEREVKLPAGGGFHALRWSPDGTRYLLQRRTADATELWVGDTAQGAPKRLNGVKLNAVLDNEFAWLSPDELVLMALPETRGPAPRFDAPAGPSVQESMGRQSPERTLQNLLTNAQDEALFSHHATSQLRRVNLKTGASRALGSPGLIASLQTVGNSQALLVERLVTPFSYQVSWQDFARQVELVDPASGKTLRELGAVRLKEGVPVEGVITGPRQYWASPLADAAIYWVEALDGGDNRNKVPHRDRLLRLDPPYQGQAREVHKSTHRLVNLSFAQTPGRAMVVEVERDRVWLTVDWLALDGSAAPQRIQDRSLRDRYRDPGQPLSQMLAHNGRSVVQVEGEHLYLLGQGAGPSGDRPFLDRFSLKDAKPAARLFQAGETHYERPLARLADGRVLTSRETFAEPPNLVLRSGPELAQMQTLTQVADPTPQLRGIQRERVRFKRADGVEMSFWLYQPPGHQRGDRRPTLVWAYPQEFTDAAVASQVSGATTRFNSFGGTNPLMLLLDGYVVLMDATMPVVGDPKTVNDSFIEQITANAKAIIDKADELGVTDRDKVVVGGHSYGAFMTANLLAHTDLFKAGMARSGAYNRTLTPFGFQAERRTLWEAQDVYLKLSPFLVADKLKEPLLMIHGEADNNAGTFPLQSQRLYQALAGTGGHVRLVMLPHEGHGYAARESQGHVLREMSDWMRRHVGAAN